MPVSKPETLNGRWDILYRDYPEVYEAFGQIEMKPDIIATLNDHFHFETYGFIHGAATIDHIRANCVTAIKWKMRVHYKQKLHRGEYNGISGRSPTKELH